MFDEQPEDIHGLCRHEIHRLENLNGLILEGVKRSGQIFGPCRICGLPVVCIPDGLPVCEPCAVKEIQESEADDDN